ncbi:MAG: hypothetical protein GXP38_05090 [Chloroflexi bacterium]|nr:hypothetical protein [Chloroflexota bacterium]
MASHHAHSRNIRERIYISGKLKLLTPAHFGNGQRQGNELVDMSLLMDEVEGKALLPGTSVGGALRNYLRERIYGYVFRKPIVAVIPSPGCLGPRVGASATWIKVC